ncbi:hypothetical protein NQZ68_000716, partial [Dissostichus eleginoides]
GLLGTIMHGFAGLCICVCVAYQPSPKALQRPLGLVKSFPLRWGTLTLWLHTHTGFLSSRLIVSVESSKSHLVQSHSDSVLSPDSTQVTG